MLNITALIIAVAGGVPLGLLIDSSIKKNLAIRDYYKKINSNKKTKEEK